MKFILIVLLLFVMRCVSKPSLSEMTALQSLYNQTNGNKWNWQRDYQEYGIPWNFTNIEEQNPCEQSLPWQGQLCCLPVVVCFICEYARCEVVLSLLSNLDYNLHFNPDTIIEKSLLENPRNPDWGIERLETGSHYATSHSLSQKKESKGNLESFF